jgi:hypothetical protein
MVIAVTALLCLAFAGSAYASTVAPTGSNNGYSASFTVSGGTKAGSPVTMVEKLGTTPATGYGAPYPLANILTKIQGISSPNGKYFPKCTVAQINAAGANGEWNGVCPKGSEVADGTVNSVILPNTTSNPMLSTASAIANPCPLGLHVYNAGGSNLAYFFTIADNSACGGLDTGAAGAYPGTVASKGGYAVNNVPEDAAISFYAGGIPEWGSLLSESLKWGDTVKVHGKKYSYIASSGCKKSRKFTAQFTATDFTAAATSPTEDAPSSSWLPAVTVKGTAKC